MHSRHTGVEVQGYLIKLSAYKLHDFCYLHIEPESVPTRRVYVHSSSRADLSDASISGDHINNDVIVFTAAYDTIVRFTVSANKLCCAMF